ncbi:hypothetical protein [Periweissella fabalis]|uniref:Uncharacterized protein n=1 Tax=Periweissella fabalis TaxID=1070421 RepID=A0A7X6N6S0_9LACO|nr:hypothetical protein [Periweissella fabalis]MCM0598373.1 hypothetical protein [Periweissella fabalis]NKZ25045.1 hypothetical protein [Periweissella fabalis]
MRKKRSENILLIILVITVMIAAFLNIASLIDVVHALMAGIKPQSTTSSIIGNIFSYGNILLFVFIVFFYDYKKKNLWLILVPYLGSMIFGLLGLLKKDEPNETTD